MNITLIGVRNGGWRSVGDGISFGSGSDADWIGMMKGGMLLLVGCVT